MPHLFRIIAVLALLVFLLRRKLNMGLVMVLGALFLAILYLTPPLQFLHAVTRGVISPAALEMTAALVFTMIIENILRNTGTLKRMVTSLSEILPDARMVMAAMPAMIGMLPSPGGAVFSAPMVQEAAAGLPMDAERKAFTNYWYRHIWEYVSPLYPGIILVSGLTGIPFQRLSAANLCFALAVVCSGVFFCFAGVPRALTHELQHRGRALALREFAVTISPIAATLLLVVIFRMNVVLAMGGITILLYLGHRYTPRQVLVSLKESVSMKALFMVAGIMIFKETLEISGSLAGLSRFFAESGMPVLVTVSLLPFVAGIMTGLTVAFVGITFPILIPLMGADGPSLGLLALAFGSGFAGVMLSPVHLCLVLTREYFQADLIKVYHRLLLPSAIVLATAIVPLVLFN